MRKLIDCHLYGILDLGYVEEKVAVDMAVAMIRGGVDLIQLRGKNMVVDRLTELAAALHKVTAESGIPLVVNDHAEIGLQVPVEGVHVGQDDEPVTSVRKTVNRSIWVGKSTHSLEQARAAQRDGADYIGFGPLYATPTKPDYIPIGLNFISQVHDEIKCPIFCIGGIKLENLPQVIAAGAKRVVIVSGLLQAGDISEYARVCKQLLISNQPLITNH